MYLRKLTMESDNREAEVAEHQVQSLHVAARRQEHDRVLVLQLVQDEREVAILVLRWNK
jgi:hypothetical protein